MTSIPTSGSRSKALRREISRDLGRTNDLGLTIAKVPAAEVDRCLTTMTDLHTSQYGPESLFLPIADDFAVGARTGALQGKVDFFEMIDADGVTVAVDAWISAGKRVSSFTGGRGPAAPRGAGKALLASAIEDACAAGFGEVDLGSGFDDWKERWATKNRPIWDAVATVGFRARSMTRARDIALRARRGFTRPG